MDFNAPSFEGFVVPQNNPPFKSQVSPVGPNGGRTMTNFLEILNKMTADEKTMVEVSSGGTPKLVGELESRQAFQDLLPSSLWAMPNVGYKKMKNGTNIVEGVETIFSLEGTPNVAKETESRQTLHNLLPLPPRASPNAGHEQEGQHGFNHFYMLNPLYRANQQQQIFDLPSSSLELEVASFLNKRGDLEQRIISSQDGTTYQPPSSSTKRFIGDDGSELFLKLNEAGDIGTRRILSPSQLIELQDQTLIYNYISANMVVPPHHLLNNNSLCSHCFSASCNGFSPSSPATRKGSVRPSYAGKSGDPEPGRCRRSDGKKWRCSKEVVADEKYCEKHRNRGRIQQRSRKITRGRKAAAADTGTVVPETSSAVVPVSVESGFSLGNLVNIQEAELRNSEPEFANSYVAALFNW
ncbi:growth-regulating factor 2 [Euphorbia peplus]|nr:growth-regulating factor 2 [Euphorbia peplus]